MKINNAILKPLYSKAFIVIYLQILVMLLISLLWLIFKDLKSCISALFGGISWIIPNVYFIHKIFRNKKQRSLSAIAKDFYIGELVKLFLSCILIVLFLKVYPIALLPFVIAFIGVVMSSFFLPIIYTKID